MAAGELRMTDKYLPGGAHVVAPDRTHENVSLTDVLMLLGDETTCQKIEDNPHVGELFVCLRRCSGSIPQDALNYLVELFPKLRQTLDENQRVELARDLYWGMQLHPMTTTWISTLLLGISSIFEFQEIIKKWSNGPCGGCGESFLLNNQEEYEFTHVGDIIKCLPCQLRKMPYAAYLRTNHWRMARMRALNNSGHRCQVCNSSRGLDVHHRTYERRGSEWDGDLLVLCRDCHGTFHRTGKLAKDS